MRKKTPLTLELCAVVVIIICSFVVRWHQIETSPNGFDGDETAWVTTSLFNKHNILASEKGLWELNDGLAESFPVSVKINQLGFLIFGNDIYSARKILAILSVFSLTVFYFLTRKFFDTITSFCLTLLYSFSTYKLILSRIAEEPSYSDLFLYFFILMILSISSKNKLLNFLFALLATIGLLLGTFSYSLAFFFPLLGLILLIIQLIKTKLRLRDKFFIFLIFLIPLISTAPKWVNNIILESDRKSYGLENAAISLKDHLFYPQVLQQNIIIARDELFKGLTYETGDMIINFNKTIIPLPIVYLGIFGVFLGLFNFKKYYSLHAWLLLAFPFIVLFGFLSARMWVNTVGALFIFSGVSIGFFSKLLKQKYLKFVPFFLYFFTLVVIYLNLFEFYESALHNSSFIKKSREVVEFGREFKDELVSDLAFVSNPDFNQSTIYHLISFYYLGAHPEKESEIKNMTMEEMSIFTPDFFSSSPGYLFDGYKFIIIDNNVLDKMADILKQLPKRKVKKMGGFLLVY